MFPSTAVQHINVSVSRPRGFLSMPLCLVASDLLTLILSVTISLGFKAAWQSIPNWQPYFRLWPFLFVFIGVYALAGLYSAVAMSPPEELQRATFASALAFLTLGAVTVSLRGATSYFTWALLWAMALTIVLFPLLRGVTRSLFANESWWGKPAVVFGAGPAGERVVKAMLDRPGMGLKPVAVVNHEAAGPGSVHGIPVMGGFELALTVPRTYKFSYAVLAMSGMRDTEFLSMVERHGLHFTRILMIPDLSNFSSLWVNPKSVGGMLGLEVCQQALAPERQWPKRLLDLTLTILGAAVVLPLIALVAMWIKLDSPGPVFYSQQRISRDSRTFRAWKFRTMVRHADQVLERCLALDPQLREEWEQNHKLKDDPRITTAGRFLRRTSLDELPQLWNVLMGDMSLVGPRPIVEEEIPKYGNKFDLYTKVKSGLTGMWQISGRNDTSYEERVNLDAFYVRNWSVWLDFYILFRTIETVIFRKGAY